MNRRIRIVLLSVFFVLILFSAFSLFSWHRENKDIQDIVKEEKKNLIDSNDENDMIFLDKKIFEDNPDTIGWLKVEGTKIDYPVVKYSDNEFYLKHDFKKNKNSAGWIFMDYKNDYDDQNLVFYGHNRKDGSMFGSIDMLFDPNFYKEHSGEILLIKEKEIIKYKIFSVYKALYSDDYNSLNFESFFEKINEFKEKSEVPFDFELNSDSQIITLSTCHYNNKYRLVIHGIKE